MWIIEKISRSSAGSGRTERLGIATFLIVLVLSILSGVVFSHSFSGDLFAVWKAGASFSQGDLANVYPSDGAYFTMLPPDAWIGEAPEGEIRGIVYPFVYPPLWAWAASLLQGVVSYEEFSSLVSFANPLLMLGMLIMAHRLAAPALGQATYVAIGAIFFWFSMAGAMALFQKQPQIMVAFLTVFAIYSVHLGRPVAGGLALAAAASIKLFPAALAIFWLASGQRRATASFCVAGGALAVLSVIVAGWPLHEAFLHEVRLISGTSLLTRLNYSVESVFAAALFPDLVTFVAAPSVGSGAGAGVGWYVLAEPAVSNLAFSVVLIGVIALLARRFHTTRGQAIALWPLSLMLLTLLSPIAWAYYFLAPLSFLPALFDRFRLRTALVLALTALILTSPFVQSSVFGRASGGDPDRFMIQWLGVLAMCMLTAAFWVMFRREERMLGDKR